MRFSCPTCAIAFTLCGAQWGFAQTQSAPPKAPLSNSATRGWSNYSSQEGQFSALFPLAPKTATRGDATHKVRAWYHSFPGGAFLVTCADMRNGASPAEIRLFEPQGMLDSSRDGLIKGARGRLLGEKKLVWQGFPARDVFYDIPQKAARATTRIIYAPPFIYQVSAIVPRKDVQAPKIKAFLNSFHTRTPKGF